MRLISVRRWFCSVAMMTLPVAVASAVEYREIEWQGKKAIVCRVNVKEEKLELFLRDDAGQPLKSFEGVNRYLATKGRRLVFGMNAGMYHANLAPVGLFASEGKQIAPLNLERGEGNFFVKPNGVFLVTTKGAARVVESSECLHLKERVRIATQSGPLPGAARGDSSGVQSGIDFAADPEWRGRAIIGRRAIRNIARPDEYPRIRGAFPRWAEVPGCAVFRWDGVESLRAAAEAGGSAD